MVAAAAKSNDSADDNSSASAKDEYIVLHDFHTRINLKTGIEKLFGAGSTYDGPVEHHEHLLSGQDHHGPLIAKKSSDEARRAIAQVKQAEADAELAAANSEGN